MDEFVARENIKRFQEQLKNCTDERQRATLRQLLAEHEQFLSDISCRMFSENPPRPREK